MRYPGATDPRFVSDFALKSAQRSLAVAMSFTQEQISNALKSVKYPGFSRDIVSFGLIKEIVSTDAETRVQMALTTNDAAVPRAIKAEAENVLAKTWRAEPESLDRHSRATNWRRQFGSRRDQDSWSQAHHRHCERQRWRGEIDGGGESRDGIAQCRRARRCL